MKEKNIFPSLISSIKKAPGLKLRILLESNQNEQCSYDAFRFNKIPKPLWEQMLDLSTWERRDNTDHVPITLSLTQKYF